MPESADTLTVTGTSAHSLSYGAWSSTINFETSNGDTKVVIDSIENAVGGTSDLYATLTINYTLTDDRTGEIASIKALYSIGGEAGAYTEMAEDTTGDSEGTNNLSTSAAGETHTFDFDTVTSLGIDFKGTIWVKIRAYDRINLIGDTMDSQIISILVDNSPSFPVITSPTDGWFDKNTTIPIIGTIPDPRAGNSDLHVKVEIASDSSFTDIELTLESAIDQVGWSYSSDGITWTDLPVSGIPVVATPALIGKWWRVIPNTEDGLSQGNKYTRACCAGILV